MSTAREKEDPAKNADVDAAAHGSSSSSDDDDEEFDFAFPPLGQLDDAVDLFADGRRHPVYPATDGRGDGAAELSSSFRELSVEGAAGSGLDGRDSAPASGYCDWNPQLDRKSRSTGTSSSRKWKLVDLVVGRSRSDGKDKFLALARPNPSPSAGGKKTAPRKVHTGMDMKTAHEIYYANRGAGDRKQSSYLPYRKALLGFRPL